MKKGFKALLADANAVIGTISPQEAGALLEDENTLFLDVRDAGERARGYIPGSVHAPRAFLEFIADPEGPMHNPAITADKRLILYCGSGGRSALAGKTLAEMGFEKVVNLEGGFQAWLQAGGDFET